MTHLISSEESNHLGRKSFCHLKLQNVPQEVDLQGPGPYRGEGAWQVICFTALSSDTRAPTFPQTHGNKMSSEATSLNEVAWLQKNLAADVNTIKTTQNNLNLCKCNILGVTF